MAHAFTPDLLKRHLNATFLTNDTLVFHSLVFATQTFIILSRAEYSSTEQAVAFWLESSVVNGFGLFDFTERPRSDAFRRGNRNADHVETLGALRLSEDLRQFVHRFSQAPTQYLQPSL